MPAEFESDVVQPGEPAWRLALLYPPQGSWTESDYLTLDAGRLVEFDDGCIEILDMPTKEHQRIVQYVFRILFDFVCGQSLGEVFVAPLPVRLWKKKFREPDVMFISFGRGDYEGYPDGADLVVEVVSQDASSRRRDLKTKIDEYAQAGIAEYWIVDPQQSKISICRLHDAKYEVAEYATGDKATSQQLPGFELDVTMTLAAANPESAN